MAKVTPLGCGVVGQSSVGAAFCSSLSFASPDFWRTRTPGPAPGARVVRAWLRVGVWVSAFRLGFFARFHEGGGSAVVGRQHSPAPEWGCSFPEVWAGGGGMALPAAGRSACGALLAARKDAWILAVRCRFFLGGLAPLHAGDASRLPFRRRRAAVSWVGS